MATKSIEAGFNQLIALFLAEIIRSRRTSLRRAAEISRRVVEILPDMKSEAQALAILSEVEKDFEEITTLKQALHFGYKPSEVRVYEQEIREYASTVFAKDMVVSSSFLQDAAKSDMTIQKLCLKYPDFCQFLAKSSKGVMLSELAIA